MRILTWPVRASLALLRLRLVRIAVLFAVVALFVSACGGSSNKNNSTAASGAPGGSKAVTGSSSSSIAGSPSGVKTGPGGSTAVSGGSGAGLPITDDLSSLNSYRWDVSLAGKGAIVAQLGPDLTGASGGAPADSVSYDITGAYIKPDKAQMQLTTGGLSVRQTVLGSQSWTTVGGVTTGPIEASPGAADDLGLTGFFDVGDIFRDVQGFDCSGSQNVNGIDTTVCSADKSDYDQMAASIAGLLDDTGVESVKDFGLQVYVAKTGGYVVKTDMTWSGIGSDNKDFSLAIHLNVTDINQVTEIKP